ncbi:ricin B lectin domain-containing protein [Cokeromyces recurvatus]|uniref:ricin B lectin domain-containing protein n=1 Tax=Cokeromyces recurvatus TaxID=90255 RepID=UPI00222101BA|nr:ricin B lectin domain-containing protein [Cokeromyces recurvatus]KAI7903298.1 ricin B lectin domain-containing protein [Cokeromyces recurvatus]
MSNFPSGWFYIQSKCSHKMVLDVTADSLKAVARIIVWPKKTKNCDNQLWTYDNGYLINKNSGMVLDVQGGILESDKPIIQYKRKMTEEADNQRWFYREDGFIYPQSTPNLVLDIRGNWTKPGTVVLLYERKYEDNLNQLWDLVPCETTDAALETSIIDNSDDEEDGYVFSSASYAL